jgi:ABC-2 type transport system permease protein
VIHELRLLLRSHLVTGSLLATLAMMLCALRLGWAATTAREAEIVRAQALQAAQHAAYLQRHRDAMPDAGDIAYYTFHVVPDPPSPLGWLSLGNRSVQPAVQRVRMLGLESQLYDGEAHNPEQAAAGVFDFGFAVVFLLPLLCIALCHDLATQDREQGRGGLLSSLAGNGRRFWFRRIAVRYTLVCAAALLPLVLFATLMSQWHPALAVVALAVAVYAAVWVCVCAWVSLRWSARASTANAMTMLALWAMTTMALPALANSLIALYLPMGHGGDIALAHRERLNDAWDLPKADTFEAFFRDHPEWRDTPPVTGRFHWKWYYAFHHVADRSVEPMVRDSERAMLERERAVEVIGIVLPSVAMQNLLDGVADSGTGRLLAHRMAVRDFHRRLRLYVYPYVFEERPMRAQDFAAMPTPRPAPSRVRHVGFAWIGLSMLLAVGLSALLRQLIRRPFT